MFFVSSTISVLRFTKIRSLSYLNFHSFFDKNNFPVPLPSSPLCTCGFMEMVFQGKCVVLSDFSLLFHQTMTFDSLHLCATFPEEFRTNHSLEVWFFSTYHVLCDTLLDALIDQAWDLGIGSSFLRIQESTMRQFCLCSTVDFFPMAACIFRMCSTRYHFLNMRRNLDIVPSKKSRRTQGFLCCPFQ